MPTSRDSLPQSTKTVPGMMYTITFRLLRLIINSVWVISYVADVIVSFLRREDSDIVYLWNVLYAW